MKKVLCLLAMLMVMSLLGCSENNNSQSITTQSSETSSSMFSETPQSVPANESTISTDTTSGFIIESENPEFIPSSTPKSEPKTSSTTNSSQLSITDSNRNSRNSVIIDEEYVYYNNYDSIYSIKRTNGEQKLVYNAGEYVKSITTDGSHLYFTTPTGLYRLNNDGGNLKLLSSDEILLSHCRLFYENNILFASDLGYEKCVKIAVKDDSVNILEGIHPSPVQKKWSYEKVANSDCTEFSFYRISPETNQRALIKTFYFKEPLMSNGVVAMYTENYVIYYDTEKSNRDYVNTQAQKGVFLDYDHYFSMYDPDKNEEQRLSVADKTSYIDFANYDAEWLYFFEGVKIYRSKYDGTEKQNIVKSHQGLTHISVVDGWIYFDDGRRVKADGSDVEEKLMGFE